MNVAERGRGELVALAQRPETAWTRPLPPPDFGCATVANGVVFAATSTGRMYGFDSGPGRHALEARARAGINACPALAGDTLLVGAGTDYPDRLNPV